MFENLIALVLAGLLLGVIYVMSRHSIIVVNRKDPNAMATIKERLAALEAAVAAAPAPVDTSTFAKEGDLTAVADRVTAIETEIGSDPAPAVDAPAA